MYLAVVDHCLELPLHLTDRARFDRIGERVLAGKPYRAEGALPCGVDRAGLKTDRVRR